LHLEEVSVHLGDQAEVGLDDPPKLLLDLFEARPERKLELSQ
jgi:hypothetical protein